MRPLEYAPVHAYKETGAARVGRIRRQTAGRMRELRQRWRDEGRPDPATLDRAIADAVRAALLASVVNGKTASSIPVREILLRISGQLVARSRRDSEAGRDVVVYDKRAVADAVHKRLLQAPRASHAVTEIAVSQSRSNGEVEDLIFEDID
ncbi:hypothetical protein [Methylobacterium sp. AMS5]|uniref:hypothetical protein n=1 Tax=Methylobacterium sp. AMS5 TaxID=925818 RepID=UPI00074F90F5|nr:hypothetical protein [Methylobacterium sp. AMS5]AMB45074.1 hypothetical protein Y590_09200 [Methylobacterium sp. AMS5]